jgi:hypothetical protein
MTTTVPVEGATTATKSGAVAKATAVAVAVEASPTAMATGASPVAEAMKATATGEERAAIPVAKKASERGNQGVQVSCHFYLMFFPFPVPPFTPMIALGRG